jgi:hypothetical protein
VILVPKEKLFDFFDHSSTQTSSTASNLVDYICKKLHEKPTDQLLRATALKITKAAIQKRNNHYSSYYYLGYGSSNQTESQLYAMVAKWSLVLQDQDLFHQAVEVGISDTGASADDILDVVADFVNDPNENIAQDCPDWQQRYVEQKHQFFMHRRGPTRDLLSFINIE